MFVSTWELRKDFEYQGLLIPYAETSKDFLQEINAGEHEVTLNYRGLLVNIPYSLLYPHGLKPATKETIKLYTLFHKINLEQSLLLFRFKVLTIYRDGILKIELKLAENSELNSPNVTMETSLVYTYPSDEICEGYVFAYTPFDAYSAIHKYWSEVR